MIVIIIAYTAWLFAGITCLGIGPATALVRSSRLPAQFWLPLAFLGASVASYCVWLVYVVDPGAGRAVSTVWLVASVAAFVWMIARGRQASALRSVLMRRDAWLPGALTLALTLAYLCVLSSRAGTPNERFTWGLPPDNDIPRLVAARMELTPVERPLGFLLSTWLVSDRPPLQSGFVLAVKPFDYGQIPVLTYQIVGTICQMGWVLAVYLLARTIGLSRRQTVCVLAACAASGFFLLHSVYVWPKLLSASLVLVAVAVMFCLAEGKISGSVGGGSSHLRSRCPPWRTAARCFQRSPFRCSRRAFASNGH